MRSLVLATFLVLAAASTSIAQEAPTTVDLGQPPAQEWLHDSWFTVQDNGVRVGWMRDRLALVEWDGAPAAESERTVHVNIAGDGNEAQHRVRFVYPRAGDQQLAFAEIERVEQAHRSARRVRRAGEHYEVLNVDGTREVNGVIALPPFRLADQLALQLFTQRLKDEPALPDTTRGIVLAIDLQRARVGKRLLELTRVDDPDGLVHFQLRHATGKDTWSEPSPLDRFGFDVAGEHLLGRLSYERTTEADALDPAKMSTLERARRVPMQGQLADVPGIGKLVLRVRGVPAEALANSARQRVTPQEDGSLLVTILRDEQGDEVSDEARALARAPSAGVDSNHPSIIATATRALSGIGRVPVQVERLLQFTARHVEYQVVLGEPAASDVLLRARGDCTEHARLFVALCRASRVPARLVTGLLWMGDRTKAFGWHAWAEVELAGRWREVDPTSGELIAHAARIRIADDVTDFSAVRGMQVELVEAVRAK